MNEYSPSTIIAVVVVAFIAGYAIVSYVLQKLRMGKSHNTLNDRDRKPSHLLPEETSDQESKRRQDPAD
jgi:hypothetical protein